MDERDSELDPSLVSVAERDKLLAGPLGEPEPVESAEAGLNRRGPIEPVQPREVRDLVE